MGTVVRGLAIVPFFWCGIQCSQIFDVFAELNEEVVEELSVQVLAHLVEDKPVADGAVGDVAANQVQVFTALKVPENQEKRKNFRVFKGNWENQKSTYLPTYPLTFLGATLVQHSLDVFDHLKSTYRCIIEDSAIILHPDRSRMSELAKRKSFDLCIFIFISQNRTWPLKYCTTLQPTRAAPRMMRIRYQYQMTR
jgi:hypothetical protein